LAVEIFKLDAQHFGGQRLDLTFDVGQGAFFGCQEARGPI
jgi:hypothetical protein